ncbi:MAG: DUF4091 domain-containing protein [Clostridiales bacterium]|nr:DUF4091 domain-containing protein [Clostridiales bacterium]
MNLNTKTLSPLEKVFYDDKLSSLRAYTESTALIGELVSFEIGYCIPDFSENSYNTFDCFINKALYRDGEKTDNSCISVSTVEHVPSVYPAVLEEEPDDYVRTMPGLYPDLLVPIKTGDAVQLLPRITSTLWVDINTDKLEGGIYKAVITFTDDKGEVLSEAEHTVKIIPMQLPKQSIAVTHWIHTDCVANYYNIEVFSDEYWTAVRNVIKTAVTYGSNMIYTPLFTPPLDTTVGGERRTVQLIDVTVTKDGYSFGFDKLRKWVQICKECGAEYYEMSHMFTQWGAYHAPKIMAGSKQIFGWDTDASGTEYEQFLSQFLPALCEELKQLGIADNTVFHISDEPAKEHHDSYCAASRIMHKYIGDFKVMDAMSDTMYYIEKLVDIPVPHVVHADPFFELNPKPRWAYYCGASKNHMGRAFGMKLERDRISGVQFYTSEIEGFLHWGFNFYNSAKSLCELDPYFSTDANKKFCSGDSFMVYPGPDFKVYNSIRLVVFRHGIDDMRSLQLCESIYGRKKVMSVISGLNGGKILGFHELPKDRDFILKLRKEINKLIENA